MRTEARTPFLEAVAATVVSECSARASVSCFRVEAAEGNGWAAAGQQLLAENPKSN
jgi:hypothetical protein